ncbi:SPOR domain-containing protein [Dyadobacter chenwenxiniae]|uniref:SPOR domain-containing protein n=1 Tax=Dyadobacter chenwenxiniae TaxID=2906456 RepID=A0A9X1TFV7_9BACT|nr:SPOR domain-containing protein [Dyadobacter chenwenxiniae]MCF0063054.1 SPOR domain-containing protein [Dyadobacter chenwenxiniae]UON84773.1 SPOR domain-containing protein [Dyadobacter chenwenxiniae]
MIAVETVIRKLVGEYEFVIIPGFGALLSHQIPAAYDDMSQTFSPPAKKLAFNEFLKLDDGLLANYISRHEGLSHTEAVDYVKHYTDELRQNLEQRGQAQITGIGDFSKNIEGKLVFEPNTEKYFKDEWYGFEKIRAKQIDKKLISVAAAETYIAEEQVEVIEAEEERSNTFRWAKWAAAAVIATIVCGLSVFLVNSKNGDIQSTLNPFAELFPKSETVSEEKTETVVVPVEVAPSPATQPVVVDSSVIATKPGEAATVVKVDSAKEKAFVPAAKPQPAGSVEPVKESKFYVIAGTFKGMRQANVLLTQLKEKGFEDASILPPDRFGKKVKVAVNGYGNETDAYRASAKLKRVIGEAGWVYVRK